MLHHVAGQIMMVMINVENAVYVVVMLKIQVAL